MNETERFNRPENRPPPHWGAFAERLSDVVLHYPDQTNVCTLIAGSEALEREALLWAVTALDRDVSNTLHCAIDEWFATKAWPALEPLASAALGTRLQCAFEFATLFVEAGSHPESSLLDWPRGHSPADVLRWMLFDWWERHGRRYAVERWQSDQWNDPLSRQHPIMPVN